MIYQCQWRSQGHIFGELDKIASDQIFPEISLILGADFIADLGFSHTPTFFTIWGGWPPPLPPPGYATDQCQYSVCQNKGCGSQKNSA